jgi:hypothetical protein
MDELALTLEQADWKFYKPFSVPNATNRAIIRTNLELGAANNVTFSNITASGTLGVSDAATFSTNVTVNGNLSVGSFTTTTPSTWALRRHPDRRSDQRHLGPAVATPTSFG